MRRTITMSVLVLSTLACASGLPGKDKATFGLPDSTLLFASYDDLRLSTVEGTRKIQLPVEVKANGGIYDEPTLCGNLLAKGIIDMVDNSRVHWTLGIYSTTTNTWKTFGDFDEIGSLVFSKDCSKITFLAKKNGKDAWWILALDSQKMTAQSFPITVAQRKIFPRSWSPVGNQMLVEIPGNQTAEHEDSSIAVFDMDTLDFKILGKGSAPSWSPNGDWIAYFDVGLQHCMVVRPDGTGVKVISKVRDAGPSYRTFGYGKPLWSPDGKSLLLSQMKGDNGIDVVLIDVATSKIVKRFLDKLPVYGWSQR